MKLRLTFALLVTVSVLVFGRPADQPALRRYQVWADELKPIFTESLGPRAASKSLLVAAKS